MAVGEAVAAAEVVVAGVAGTEIVVVHRVDVMRAMAFHLHRQLLLPLLLHLLRRHLQNGDPASLGTRRAQVVMDVTVVAQKAVVANMVVRLE